MAQRVQVTLVDDLDGGAAQETVSFSLDGVAYEIDLSAANAVQLREAIGEWVGKARRATARGRNRGRRPAVANDTAKVREWARNNGFTVSDRGRIPSEVRSAYDAAN